MTNSDKIKQLLGVFWSRVWKDPELVDGLAAAFAYEWDQVEDSVTNLKAYLSRFTLPLGYKRSWSRYRLEIAKLKPRTAIIGSFVVGDSMRVADPEDPVAFDTDLALLDVASISEKPINPTITLKKGVHFDLKDGLLYFHDIALLNAFPRILSVDKDGKPAEFIDLWLRNARVEDMRLKEHFGFVFDLNVTSTERCYRMLNATWDLRVQGATVANINRMLAAITDCDICEAEGIVGTSEVRDGRLYVTVSGREYSAPAIYSSIVAKGDLLKEGDLIFDSFTILDPNSPIDEAIIPAITLDASLISARYNDGLVFVNKKVMLTPLYTEGIVLPIFEIGGSEDAVKLFREDLKDKLATTGVDLWGLLTKDQKYPYTINPFQFVSYNFLANNMKYVIFKHAPLDLNMLRAGAAILVDTLPAGTNILIFQVAESIVSGFNASNVTEEITGSLSLDGQELINNANEGGSTVRQP